MGQCLQPFDKTARKSFGISCQDLSGDAAVFPTHPLTASPIPADSPKVAKKVAVVSAV